MRRRLSLASAAAFFLLTAAVVLPGSVLAAGATCPAPGLPDDVDASKPATAQQNFEVASWQTLRYMARDDGKDEAPLWTEWQSTVDFLKPNDTEGVHKRFYPEACKKAYPKDYQKYRVLTEVSKVNDGFLEAETGGLSHSPVIAANGTFLRYEILLHSDTSKWLAQQIYKEQGSGDQKWTQLQPVAANFAFPCGGVKSGEVSLVIKNAWMEVSPKSSDPRFKAWKNSLSKTALGLYKKDVKGISDRTFHTEELLVHTPAGRTQDGAADQCELREMGLVGMHIARKTPTQPGWIWSTFEHVDNAPDCTALPPRATGGIGDPGPANSCPREVEQTWNFYGQLCNMGNTSLGYSLASGHPLEGLICQSCNRSPHPNGNVNQQNCLGAVGPNDASDRTGKAAAGWCLDDAPHATGGFSMLCRQVPVGQYYQQAAAVNTACHEAVKSDVWKNYELISTQWIKTAGLTCATNEANTVYHSLGKVSPKGGDSYTLNIVKASDILPTVPIWPNDAKPYLGNTAIESYERSNCTGCHAKADTDGDVNARSAASITTDFMYFLALELPEAIKEQKAKHDSK